MPEPVSPTHFSWRTKMAEDWLPRCSKLDARIRALDEKSAAAEFDAISIEARRLAGHALGPHENLKMERVARRMLAQHERFAGLRHLRVALISNRTVAHLIAPLSAEGLVRGLLVEAFEVPHEWVVQRALDRDKPGEFSRAGAPVRPDILVRAADASVIIFDENAFRGSDAPLDGEREEQALGDAQVFLTRTVALVDDEVGGRAIVSTLPLAAWNISSCEAALGGSSQSFVLRLNRLIADGAQSSKWLMWDLAALASRVGGDCWFDVIRFHEAKLPFRFELAPLVADHLCRTLAAISGKSCRALVLDLDDTLWGGVVGDDGIAGIRLGQNSAEGEAYVAFQRFLLNLRQRGIVLAVCSKNSEAIAREPFQHHPEMLLREEHFAVFQTNWLDKAANLRVIAETLGLGLESIAFADDNPAERARVRQELPLVSVIELGSEPAFYPARIADSGVFDHLPLNSDDRLRADSYRRRASGAALAATIDNYDDYLRSLKMTISVSRFDAIGRSRIAQLINKSNQFNLTTRRYSETDVRRIEENPGEFLCWQVRLDDAFGQHGIISVLIVRKLAKVWTIDTWLMSCRVLTRGVEETLMNMLMQDAREAGVQAVIGEYIPASRNALVADLYSRMGFAALERDPSGASRYSASPASYVAAISFLEVRRPDSG
jgi:FkbH-like protein